MEACPRQKSASEPSGGCGRSTPLSAMTPVTGKPRRKLRGKSTSGWSSTSQRRQSKATFTDRTPSSRWRTEDDGEGSAFRAASRRRACLATWCKMCTCRPRQFFKSLPFCSMTVMARVQAGGSLYACCQRSCGGSQIRAASKCASLSSTTGTSLLLTSGLTKSVSALSLSSAERAGGRAKVGSNARDARRRSCSCPYRSSWSPVNRCVPTRSRAAL